MLSFPDARDRALHRAVETGILCDMGFIHAVQEAEGTIPCFGRMDKPCSRVSCRWHAECMALLEVRAVAREPVFA